MGDNCGASNPKATFESTKRIAFIFFKDFLSTPVILNAKDPPFFKLPTAGFEF